MNFIKWLPLWMFLVAWVGSLILIYVYIDLEKYLTANLYLSSFIVLIIAGFGNFIVVKLVQKARE